MSLPFHATARPAACPACGTECAIDEPCPSCHQAPAKDRVGTVLAGRYELQEVIGRRGFGVVYRAKQLALGSTVAVKFLLAEWARLPETRARFEREAAALVRLHHPGIVAALDFGEDAGELYLVMEWVPGRDLAHSLRDELSPERIVAILDQVLEVLELAHGQGIVHHRKAERGSRSRSSREHPRRLVRRGHLQGHLASAAVRAPPGRDPRRREHSRLEQAGHRRRHDVAQRRASRPLGNARGQEADRNSKRHRRCRRRVEDLWDPKSATRLAVYEGKSALSASGAKVDVQEGFGSKAELGKAPTPPKPLPRAPTWSTPIPRSILTFGDADVSGTFTPAHRIENGDVSLSGAYVALAGRFGF